MARRNHYSRPFCLEKLMTWPKGEPRVQEQGRRAGQAEGAAAGGGGGAGLGLLLLLGGVQLPVAPSLSSV